MEGARQSYVRHMGRERSRVLGVRSADPVMSVIAPVGLASAAGTALLVDLGAQLGAAGTRTLADLVGEGPRLDELSPGRTGVAVIRAGHVDAVECFDLIARLSSRWPAVVVRVVDGTWGGPVVPVCPLYPGWLAPDSGEPSVWQAFPWSTRPPGPGPVLPNLRPTETRRMLAGGLPSRGRWLKTWERVWGLPWA